MLLSGQIPAPAALSPVKNLGHQSAPEPVWIAWKQEKFLVSAWIRSSDRPARSLDTVPNTLSMSYDDIPSCLLRFIHYVTLFVTIQ